jgi:hypothetical protein
MVFISLGFSFWVVRDGLVLAAFGEARKDDFLFIRGLRPAEGWPGKST